MTYSLFDILNSMAAFTDVCLVTNAVLGRRLLHDQYTHSSCLQRGYILALIREG